MLSPLNLRSVRRNDQEFVHKGEFSIDRFNTDENSFNGENDLNHDNKLFW